MSDYLKETIRDMRYINYQLARRSGAAPERLATVFPQAESFERMYQSERATLAPLPIAGEDLGVA